MVGTLANCSPLGRGDKILPAEVGGDQTSSVGDCLWERNGLIIGWKRALKCDGVCRLLGEFYSCRRHFNGYWWYLIFEIFMGNKA